VRVQFVGLAVVVEDGEAGRDLCEGFLLLLSRDRSLLD
jgi:hypothetical protein